MEYGYWITINRICKKHFSRYLAFFSNYKDVAHLMEF